MLWSTVQADQFCTLITDGTHDSPKPQQSGWKLITSKHLKGHYIDFDSANWIGEADYLKVISRSAVEQWDILFSMIGTIGNIYLEKNPHVEYACKNMGIFKFSGNKENALWMYYYLKSPQAKAYIQTHLRGSTQSYVPLGSLRDMPVPVPPQSVRNEIIAILSPIDEKIECNNAINEYFYAKSLFEHGFTINSSSTPPQMPVGSCISRSDGDAAHYKIGDIAALLTKSPWSALPTKKDVHRRHPACFIIRFRFNAVAGKRQWPSAASKPRRRTRAKLCSRFCFRRTAPRLFQITSGTPCGKTASGGAAARRCCDPAHGRRGRGPGTSAGQCRSGYAARSPAPTGCRTGNRPAGTSR